MCLLACVFEHGDTSSYTNFYQLETSLTGIADENAINSAIAGYLFGTKIVVQRAVL